MKTLIVVSLLILAPRVYAVDADIRFMRVGDKVDCVYLVTDNNIALDCNWNQDMAQQHFDDRLEVVKKDFADRLELCKQEPTKSEKELVAVQGKKEAQQRIMRRYMSPRMK